MRSLQFVTFRAKLGPNLDPAPTFLDPAMTQLTDVRLRALIKRRPANRVSVPDGSVRGLSIRVGPSSMTWSLKLRVRGDGGVSNRGHELNGKTYRVTLGEYPTVSIDAARALAHQYWDQAKKGISPVKALEESATAGGLTVSELGQSFISDYVKMRELKAFNRYQCAINVHIIPQLGTLLADRVTRDDVRAMLKRVLEKKERPIHPRGRPRGGKEAARTTMSVLRTMFAWAITEGMIKRRDNPASGMERNLPKKNSKERVLSLTEARVVYSAADALGYPFGPVYRLLLLTGCRPGEWSGCQRSFVDLDQALLILPAKHYKSDHVHIVPLVPAAVAILREVFEAVPRSANEYIFSGTGGKKPVVGWPKVHERMLREICAVTGEKVVNRWTPHDLRRTVATRLAETLGVGGEQMIRRVLGHSDGSVTAIYNRYGYVKEMRAVLNQWADELTQKEGTKSESESDSVTPLQTAQVPDRLVAAA